MKGISVLIALDNVRSHHNVGSIFRTSDAFAVKEVILAGITPIPPHRDIHKTALGATESVAWRRADNLVEELRELQASGTKVIGIEQCERSTSIMDAVEFRGDCIIVLGNEVTGISNEILDICDEVWEIPQDGVKQSMNVSVCAGIVLFHLRNLSD